MSRAPWRHLEVASRWGAVLSGQLVPFVSACQTLPPGQSAVDSVSIRGTDAIGAGDVEDKLATEESPKFLGLFRGVVYDYEVFNAATLQRDLARIERYYRSRGYYDARARAGRVIPHGDGHVRVEILVDEGLPARNDRLTIDGIAALPPAVQRSTRWACLRELRTGAPFEEDGAARCETAARRALTDAGYAYATVKRDSYVDVARHVANTSLTVIPGETATFGAITFEDTASDATKRSRPQIPLAPLKRAIDIVSGEPYSTARIDAATQALLDLGIFATVTIVPDLSHPESHVIALTVRFQPSKLREIRLGGGLEFDEIKTELHVLAGWEDHNFLGDLRDFSVDFSPGVDLYPTLLNHIVAPQNLLPEERLRAKLKQPGFLEARTEGFVRSELNVFPLLVGIPQETNSPVPGFLEVKNAVGADRAWFGRLFVSLSYATQVEYPFAYLGQPQDLRPLTILYPDLVTWLDFRDDREHPHAGFYLANDLQFAGGFFGGDTHDVRVLPEARAYLPVGKKVTLATRASVGFLLPVNYEPADVFSANAATAGQAIETVLFRGFFSGGPSSNRGYPLRAVGPHGIVPFLSPSLASAQVASGCVPASAANGFTQPGPQCAIPIGGFTLWELSTELRFPIKGPVWAAVFCDSGDVSQNPIGRSGALRFDHLHLSCGLGARYDTPVGPIRLDAGYRVQPLQVVGFPNEAAVYAHDPTEGLPPTLLPGSVFGAGIPMAIAIGIGEAY
ncbi:MAG TPA: BamA/TamA family outer membrane protein [Polyangiaceae bacterium]|nr:BamA/TamA family outer membrane protein [Polyangiaceae bacterium]